MPISHRANWWLILAATVVLTGRPTSAQTAESPGPAIEEAAPNEVLVNPRAQDQEIARRLSGIYGATPDWLRDVSVNVDEGVVILRGIAEDERRRQWAGDVARKTQDVVAVINQITVTEPPILNFDESLAQLRSMGRQLVQSLPLIVVSIVALLITFVLTRWIARNARRHLGRRMQSPLLAQLLGNAIAVPVFILGLYVVLRVANLTNLALTVLGGTGLFGLVLGIAFRDIVENYLASILISTRRPFRLGDTIEVAGVTGVVQTVTTRGTLVITPDGNHVLIPNSTVYKTTVTNRTANPNSRHSFVVGIGTDQPVAEAQRVAMEVLKRHEAVLEDPPPMVLLEELAASTVNLRVYFWVNETQHAAIRVKSAIIRLVRRALMEADISMPAQIREVTFPQGVPVQLTAPCDETAVAPSKAPPLRAAESDVAATEAEAGLDSEKADIQEQARRSDFPDQGEDLLRPDER